MLHQILRKYAIIKGVRLCVTVGIYGLRCCRQPNKIIFRLSTFIMSKVIIFDDVKKKGMTQVNIYV